MTDAEILTVLRSDLGELYPSEQRLAYLTQAVNAAKEFIAREGVTLTDSVEDGQLVEMYAAYLVRKRASNGGDSVAPDAPLGAQQPAVCPKGRWRGCYLIPVS